MRGKLYIAGPMSGYDDLNYPLFNGVAKLLRDADWEIVNPAEFEPNLPEGLSFNARHAIFLREDFAELATCSGIVLLPGWADSTGANCELFVAQMIDLASYVWEEDQARFEPHLYADLDLILDHINAVNWPGEEA